MTNITPPSLIPTSRFRPDTRTHARTHAARTHKAEGEGDRQRLREGERGGAGEVGVVRERERGGGGIITKSKCADLRSRLVYPLAEFFIMSNFYVTGAECIFL